MERPYLPGIKLDKLGRHISSSSNNKTRYTSQCVGDTTSNMSPPTGQLSVLIIQTCLAVFCVSRTSAAEQGAVTAQKRFQLCPRGSTLTGQPALTAVNARSAVECAVSCATTSGCGSYNFCPDDPSVATRCQLLADRNSPSCADLTSLSGSSCRHGYKVRWEEVM